MNTESVLSASFDFDGCLDSNPVVREILRLYQAAGKKVYILTNRSPEITGRNYPLFMWAERLNIPREDILYAWDTEKHLIITEKSIDVHYDNDTHEIHKINMNCGPHVGVLVHYTYTSNDMPDE